MHKYLPQHTLSRIVGWLANRQWGWLTRWAITLFIHRYDVAMQEAEHQDIKHYSSFNAFFTRHLKPELRPITTDSNAVASPVDGIISEVGKLTGEQIVQAKHHYYTLTDLLGGDNERAKLFHDGYFFTAYLAPRNYHRIHMPIDGQLLEMIHIPGRLFSVNPSSVQTVPRLFARNERIVCLFETKAGPMAVVIVGATLVGSIETVWHGTVTPSTPRSVAVWKYHEKKITLARGEELGYFKMGSTVILLFPEHAVAWESYCQANRTICFGEKVGIVKK